MHEDDVRPPNEKSHAYHLALLTTDVIFAYDPFAILALPKSQLKEGVCKFVVSFALDPVLVIAFEIVRHCTKMST